jgi:hypothetical protein
MSTIKEEKKKGRTWSHGWKRKKKKKSKKGGEKE